MFLSTLSIQTSGITTIKFLVDHVTEADRELVRNVEQELINIRLEDDGYDVSKVVFIIRKLVNTLTTNEITTQSLTYDCIYALHNDLCCEDCRMGVIFFWNKIITRDQQ